MGRLLGDDDDTGRLPELGRSLGKGIREFRGSITGDHDDKEEEPDDKVPELQQPVVPDPAPPDAEAVEGEVVAEKRS